ncbi:histamine H2 receptor-like [Ruditapes philippinarum]|uniref:histamine H2 receptor-like n=1 Tax=Ruditapes philippinarum TaxID=129788 RepID=UPI00295AEB65|nr:histamine H2 receptor-like [Ruditapes philippinarum]
MSGDIYHTVWHVLYVIIMIPIVVGNGLIILSILKDRKLRTNMHILIGNLAASDLITGLFLIPYDLGFERVLDHNMYICFGKLSLFVISLGSLLYHLWDGMCILTIIQYVSVTHCGRQATKSWVNWELITALIFNFVLYTIVMKIAVRKACDKNHIKGGIRNTAKIDKDVYQMMTMVIVLGVFVICWLPYVCAAVVVTFYETPYTQYIRRCTLIPGVINSAVNWLIYGYRNSEFRKAFKAWFQCRLLCKKPNNATATVTSTQFTIT